MEAILLDFHSSFHIQSRTMFARLGPNNNRTVSFQDNHWAKRYSLLRRYRYHPHNRQQVEGSYHNLQGRRSSFLLHCRCRLRSRKPVEGSYHNLQGRSYNLLRRYRLHLHSMSREGAVDILRSRSGMKNMFLRYHRLRRHNRGQRVHITPYKGCIVCQSWRGADSLHTGCV